MFQRLVSDDVNLLINSNYNVLYSLDMATTTQREYASRDT
jgi:hypothetical protein